MVMVRITETYDMKTTVNKMGIVSVHTPTVALLRKLYPGLMKNHRFVRFVKCDVSGACASILPADPLQVGVTAGRIAPEDMFNPILYTAVTNSSFDTMIARINALTDVTTLQSVGAGDVAGNMNADNNFKIYYSLLAENGKYRKAMPQSGFVIKGLVPLAHTLVSTYGNVGNSQNDNALSEDGETPIPVPEMDVPTIDASWADSKTTSIFYRGKSVKMPKFPLHTGKENIDTIPFPNIPKTQVLAILLPPAKLNEFYYRLRITWYVRFEQICSTLESPGATAIIDIGGIAHGQNYTFTSAKSELDNSNDMVDGTDVDINKIMES